MLRQLPVQALSMINGKLLGDGNISIEKTRSPRFRFSHSIHDQSWFFHCYKQLSNYLPLSKPKYRKVLDPRTKNGFTEHYYTQSRKCEIVQQLKTLWYPHNRKMIPFEFLSLSFTPLCLAWWYQDDGHLKMENNQIKKIILSTDGFTTTENETLIKLIKKRYGLTFKLDKYNRLVLYDKPQIIYFIRLIEPFVHESMSRKITIPSLPRQGPKKKRTTIYLPSSIHISRPTQEIHHMLKQLPIIYNKLQDTALYRTWFIENLSALKINKATATPYQITLTEEHLRSIHDCRQRAGLTVSEVVYLCAVEHLNKQERP
ncbi:endonuclease [Geobacillus sp. BMUD]|uniref:endonuclease n=1 Tax=Geobacillus sp. BMUD TaxID=2508876 RepID=UPI001493020F|nr:endonuclease [Geobacillus sp. BMUD]NNU84987.1 endonuclease [Geobacillus sp. BMUD]